MFQKKSNVHLDWIISFMMFFMFLIYAVTFFIPNILKENNEEVSFINILDEYLSDTVYIQKLYVSDMSESDYVIVNADVLEIGDYNLIEGSSVLDYFYFDDLLFIKKNISSKNELTKIKNPSYDYSVDKDYDIYFSTNATSNNNWELFVNEENLTIDFGSKNLIISYGNEIDSALSGIEKFIGYLYFNTSENEYKYYISDQDVIKAKHYFDSGSDVVFEKHSVDYIYEYEPSSVFINGEEVVGNYTYENRSVSYFSIIVDGITHNIGEESELDLLDVKFVYSNSSFYYTVEFQNLNGAILSESFSLEMGRNSDYDFLNRGFLETKESSYKTSTDFANLNYQEIKSAVGKDFSLVVWQGGLVDSFNLSNSPYYKYNIKSVNPNVKAYNDRFVMQHIDKWGNEEPITIYTILW